MKPKKIFPEVLYWEDDGILTGEKNGLHKKISHNEVELYAITSTNKLIAQSKSEGWKATVKFFPSPLWVAEFAPAEKPRRDEFDYGNVFFYHTSENSNNSFFIISSSTSHPFI